MLMKSLIVVPCFNESQRFPVNAFCEFLREQNSVQFIFVDDGSTDNTFQILKSLNTNNPKNTNILQLAKNSGKAEAVRQGMLLALSKKPDLVGFWDADLATPLAEIPRFIAIFSTYPDIKWVFASRVKLLGRQIKRNELRHYFGRVFATFVSLVLKLPIYDSQCGAKMFRAGAELEKIISEKFRSRWIFDVELIARLMRYLKKTNQNPAHTIIYEIPLNTWVDVKGSKLKAKDFFIAIIDLFFIWKYLRSKGSF
jgi:glycosyltransferase involved in cell wall biosynthesis